MYIATIDDMNPRIRVRFNTDRFYDVIHVGTDYVAVEAQW